MCCRRTVHGLANAGACLPSAIPRTVTAAFSSGLGFYVAEEIGTLLQEWSESHSSVAISVSCGAIGLGGGLIAWTAGGLIRSGLDLRAPEHARRVPGNPLAVRAILLLFTAVFPLGFMFFILMGLENNKYALRLGLTVLSVYNNSAVRETVMNVLVPKHQLVSLVEYDGDRRLEHSEAVSRRAKGNMLASIAPNIASAAANRFYFLNLVPNNVLREAGLRGAYDLWGQVARGAAAEMDGPDGRVRPAIVLAAPPLSLKELGEKFAFRALFALAPAGFYALADSILETDNPEWAYYLMTVLGVMGSAVAELRGPVLEQCYAGQHLRVMDAEAPAEQPAVALRI